MKEENVLICEAKNGNFVVAETTILVGETSGERRDLMLDALIKLYVIDSLR